ncbi:hypothetical protein pb186bvf_003610 [Paramecium bursaria]
MIFLLLTITYALNYSFQANREFLHVEILNQPSQHLYIGIIQNGQLIVSTQQNYDNYLELYFPLSEGGQYDIEIDAQPANNFSITQSDTNKKTCLYGNSSGQSCDCNQSYAGYFNIQINILSDRCQYIIHTLQQNIQQSVILTPFSKSILQIQTDPQVDQIIQLELSAPQLGQIYLFNNSQKLGIMAKEGILSYNETIQTKGVSQVIIELLNDQSISILEQVKYTVQNKQQLADYIIIIGATIGSLIILIFFGLGIKYLCFKKKSEQNLTEDKLKQYAKIDVFDAEIPCPICYSPLKQSSCRQTLCLHIVHESCLIQWLEKRDDCPHCSVHLRLNTRSPQNSGIMQEKMFSAK